MNYSDPIINISNFGSESFLTASADTVDTNISDKNRAIENAHATLIIEYK